MKNHFFKCLITLLLSHYGTPASIKIADFDYSTDMPALETLIKHEWHSLFWMPSYDSSIIKIMFKERKPGDMTARNLPLTIKTLKDGSSLLGFVTYYFANKEVGHIELLAIDKTYKGHGYGKKLVNYVHDQCKSKNCKTLELYVYTSNQKAIAFYHHIGFTTQKTFPGYLLLAKKIQ